MALIRAIRDAVKAGYEVRFCSGIEGRLFMRLNGEWPDIADHRYTDLELDEAKYPDVNAESDVRKLIEQLMQFESENEKSSK